MSYDTSQLKIHVIPVDEQVQLQIEGGKYASVFRGAAEPRLVFLDIPKQKGKYIQLKKHQKVSVRYIHQGVVYGFKTKVKSQSMSPFRILILEYPKTFESHNLRRSERITTFIPATATLPWSAEPSEAAILDLSREGALLSLKTNNIVERDTAITISFDLPGDKKISDLPCAARSHRGKGKENLVGVEFDKEKTEQMLYLQKFYDDCTN